MRIYMNSTSRSSFPLESFGCMPFTIRADTKMRLASLKQSFSLCHTSSNSMGILMKSLLAGCETELII